MRPLVTVAIPVYKRLHLLPGALRSVAAQDYPELELLVSDNGENGPEVRELVERHYPRPFRFRRNEVSEPIMSRHFNQLVESASGEYFVLLCDDDEIGPTFVSNLAAILEADPDVAFALPRVEVLDEAGQPYADAQEHRLPPEVFNGTDLPRMWGSGEYRFWNFVTMMARTREIRATGGYPDMPNGDDDAVVLKLALGRKVGFCKEAVFRNRWYETSAGLAVSAWELAADVRAWLKFIDSDPVLQKFAAANPVEWNEIRRLMLEKGWKGYRHRWKSMYRKRMGRMEWVRAGFALPWIPAYYRWLIPYLLRRGLTLPKRLVAG